MYANIRPACRKIIMTDNLALSFVLLIMEGMAQKLDETAENDPLHGTARPQSPAAGVG